MEVSNRAKWIVGLVLALVLALSTYLGVNNPQPVVVDTPVFEQTRGGAVQVNKLVVQDTLNYGSSALYPVGNSVDGKELYFGTVLTPVAAATVPASAHALATVVFASCEPVNKAATGAWSCGAKVGSSNQITLSLYTLAATPVPTAAYGGVRWVAGGN